MEIMMAGSACWRRGGERDKSLKIKAEKEKVSTEETVVRPIKITPEAPRAIPKEKSLTDKPEPEAKLPAEVKPKVETKNQKHTVRKPEVVYIEYGRTIV